MPFNILVSLAGKSSRFFENGFTQPKYYLPMADEGKTMIEAAIDTLDIHGKLILIIQQEHIEKYSIDKFLKEKYPDAVQCVLTEYTQGAVESCYKAAKQLIDNDTPLIISNCDQALEWNPEAFVQKTLEEGVDGCILTFFANTIKNSYARVESETTKVLECAEKKVISPHSLVGVHSWKRGSDFCRAAEIMFRDNIRANNEFYVSISYNPLIAMGRKIYMVPLQEDKGEKYWSVGTPEQYFDYLQAKFGSVKTSSLSQMKRGWLIGDFTPAVLRTRDFEVGYLRHAKGEKWPAHVHKKADEYNVLVRGQMILNNETIDEGEIFVVRKGMLTRATFLEDCEVLCIKVPSDTKDKYCY